MHADEARRLDEEFNTVKPADTEVYINAWSSDVKSAAAIGLRKVRLSDVEGVNSKMAPGTKDAAVLAMKDLGYTIEKSYDILFASW